MSGHYSNCYTFGNIYWNMRPKNYFTQPWYCNYSSARIHEDLIYQQLYQIIFYIKNQFFVSLFWYFDKKHWQALWLETLFKYCFSLGKVFVNVADWAKFAKFCKHKIALISLLTKLNTCIFFQSVLHFRSVAMMSSQAPLPLIPWSMGLYLPKMGHMDWDTKIP